MALEANCWIVLTRAPRCLLGGDPFQLPPTVLSPEAAGLEETLFERLYTRHGEAVTTLLEEQYRMHKVISDWSSHQFYKGRLRPWEGVEGHLLCDLEGVEETSETSTPFVLVDTASLGLEEVGLPGESKYNVGEVQVVEGYIRTLREAGVAAESIVVLTPYSAQTALLRDKLEGIEVGTVDSMQGRERDCVIISLVRSNSDGEVGFLSEARRVNVAITRARRHVAIVTDSNTVQRDACLRAVCACAEEEGAVLPAEDYF
eukprot:Hpha_TRINITY_DN2013_c0_g1::TRINITY_DN2013_c0_g1_i1::g.82915::m.82915/K19036/IGHMBP2; ATP-dependent RNA/DNA helicase IGHMBP2